MDINARCGASLAYGGRNEIRVNNSAGRCLLENWFEERINRERDPALDREYDKKERAAFLRQGHVGLITVNKDAEPESTTTFRAAYKEPDVDMTRQIGSRKELRDQSFVLQVCEEMAKEREDKKAAEIVDAMCTTFMKDYTKEFQKIEAPLTKDHNFVKEQPVTFWSEHRDRIHGSTQVKTRDSAFRKNDAFSKPLGEYWDEPKPYEQDQYPMM